MRIHCGADRAGGSNQRFFSLLLNSKLFLRLSHFFERKSSIFRQSKILGFSLLYKSGVFGVKITDLTSSNFLRVYAAANALEFFTVSQNFLFWNIPFLIFWNFRYFWHHRVIQMLSLILKSWLTILILDFFQIFVQIFGSNRGPISNFSSVRLPSLGFATVKTISQTLNIFDFLDGRGDKHRCDTHSFLLGFYTEFSNLAWKTTEFCRNWTVRAGRVSEAHYFFRWNCLQFLDVKGRRWETFFAQCITSISLLEREIHLHR